MFRQAVCFDSEHLCACKELHEVPGGDQLDDCANVSPAAQRLATPNEARPDTQARAPNEALHRSLQTRPRPPHSQE
eukprot:7239267-Pyramimonas_sp.AAC.1